jgi:small subunit ribosomal protein S2
VKSPRRRPHLFVGTKRQAASRSPPRAKRCAQYYVNHRWLGGTLTNWRTVRARSPACASWKACWKAQSGRTKKELLQLNRERDKLELSWAASRTWAASRPDVRDRHQQGSDRNPGSAQAQHPGDRDPGHELQPDGITFPIPATTTPRAPSNSTAT